MASRQKDLLFGDVDARPVKERGGYYTPEPVVQTLVAWAVQSDADRLLDPSCGDGRFIATHRNSVGIEQDAQATRDAVARAPWALVHEGDFFSWAENTSERFECAAGNPPFIRYQSFKGEVREKALSFCAQHGAVFSGLASSWAPFLVAAASLLKPSGRMAFVVPAEIGHAPYAAPLVEFLVSRFSHVQIVAIREKIFPELSEDCWLLYATGFGGSTNEILLSPTQSFRFMSHPPRNGIAVPVKEWRKPWNQRLRPYLISAAARDLYFATANIPKAKRLGDVASVGIGYVTGANEFFHLKPSHAQKLGISGDLLLPSVRNGRMLPSGQLTTETVKGWYKSDLPMLLLKLAESRDLPAPVKKYLESNAGRAARETYKCRNRSPWYVVPDVVVPDYFLSYMCGGKPSLVLNTAGCSCTNSLHAVRLKNRVEEKKLQQAWGSPMVELSCELEGHPLGGGMLKLEPREAARILIADTSRSASEAQIVTEAIETMRHWRHCA
jgi:adenine-specific DNA-methyltransferase